MDDAQSCIDHRHKIMEELLSGMMKLMQEQNDVMKHFLSDKSDTLERSLVSHEIRQVLDILNKMNERQAAAAACGGTNVTHLSLSSPAPFVPDANAVRVNLYWSISLVLSISVASLGVTSRVYIAMLSLSRHRRPHKELGELHRRWVKANQLLGLTIETLPQLLIAPVALLVIGIVDTLFSNAIPIYGSTVPISIAGIISCCCMAAVVIYTVWAVIHGCLYLDVSPFQSSLSQASAMHLLPLVDKARPPF
ncbi:uncharacterized protein STEHIDRAFT_152515 [Stereum hirsutum FP-91666 SS1]|uniref:uncharacterized protein n=1 Tax=Stereum hirsutum (strain FP-91666) TaxID=721885 RepID=UPI000440D4D6|nr:uncharacterized protein STEHIDRAFT_152515 [Stereum hirsutum FP-91666 SS1]EIM90822.1 hypothetical protein STEHIDRAFT_152515 [Stereum hirsutum FP-91666 SS1]